MKRRIKIWIDAVSYFFNFRKPVLREFNCIDLVAGNKLLFLMAWDMANAGRIILNPGRRVYRNTAGAAIIALLPATTSVDIIIRNCWRRTVISIPLKYLSLDKESFEWLTNDLRLFTRIEMAEILPTQTNFLPKLRFYQPVLQEFYYQAKINPQFNYQNLHQHEP